MARPSKKAPRARSTTRKPLPPVARIAARVPLSHFPAATRFTDWSAWTGLQSTTSLGRSLPDPLRDPTFKALAEEHVFTFAGPCAYTRNGAIGDVALWFHPDVEKAATGSASPFDTGALEKGHLRPWQTKPIDERRAFFDRTRAPVPGWRARFEAWLSESYSDARRYLETDQGRDASGHPDRADPDGVFAANKGTDRRAWTWEVRFERRVPLGDVEALLLPRRLLKVARNWRAARGSGRKVEFFLLTRETAVAADDLFRESGRVCKKLVGLR